MELKSVILFLIIFLANTVETITGFGGTILALTLGSFFLPLEELIILLLPINLILNGVIVFKNRREIPFKIFFKDIFFIMGIGLLIGVNISLYLTKTNNVDVIKKILAVIVLFVALTNLISFKLKTFKIHHQLWILKSGIVHGMLTTGGPFLVIAMNNMFSEKMIIRNLLSTTWLVINLTLFIYYNMIGKYNASIYFSAFLYSLSAILSIYIGEKILKKIEINTFKKVTYSLMLIAGIILLFK